MKRTPFIASIIVIALSQCAKQTSPTGGPKDEIPPKLEKAIPADKSTNFTSSEIVLVFDEQIQINNAREQLIITPSIGTKFELIAHKNKATFKFNVPLKDSTTYTINFREAIQDLTEKNPASNLKVAFSTGPHLDSLSIQGTVVDLLSGTNVKDYTVALVPASDTFDIFKHPAHWLSITDKEGKFLIENLKRGSYIIYAVNDKSKNLIVDSKSEAYGFLKDQIDLTESIKEITIPTLQLDARQFKLISARPLTNYFNIKATKSIVTYSIEPIDPAITLYVQKTDDLTNIKIYNTLEHVDSTAVHFMATDSLESKIDTTLYIKFDSKPSLSKEKFTSKIEYVNYYKTSNILEAAIKFSKPVTHITLDSLYLQLDSLMQLPFKKEDINWRTDQTRFTISIKPAEKIERQGENQINKAPIAGRRNTEKQETDTVKATQPIPVINKLMLKKSAFTSVENDSSSEAEQSLKIITAVETGVITVEVKATENFILQIVDQKFNMVQEVINQSHHKFENLTPGSYMLRLLIDRNKNGKWDPGNFYKKEEPEPVVFYKNEKLERIINIKANWELGPLLITYE